MKDKISRRQFIKQASLATAGSAAATQASAMGFFPLQKEVKTVKALIIGSGFGGSVSALRLGQQGIETLVLERGQWWIPEPGKKIFSSNFLADRRSTWFKNLSSPPVKIETPIRKYAGVLDYEDFDGLRMYQGAAVGGGSVIYGGVTVRSPRFVLESILPSGIDLDEFENKFYAMSEAMIQPETIPDDVLETDYYIYARMFKEQAEKAGYSPIKTPCAFDYGIIREEIAGNVEPSALIGETIYGNNSGCKKMLTQSYLKQALETGSVSISALTEVQSIDVNPEGGYIVYANIINEWGHVQSQLEVYSEHLFMAAGTVNTNKLLLMAKDNGVLPNLNQHAGTQVGGNAGVIYARTVLPPTGQQQAAPLTFTVKDFDNPIGPLNVESIYFPAGLDTHTLMQIGLFFDEDLPGPGTFYLEDGELKLDWPEDANEKATQAHLHMIDKLIEENGGIKGIPIILPEPSSSHTSHPLGGMPIGLATDGYGRVNNYANLYVMDGSLIPGSCLVNPSLTIAALAERNIENILMNELAQATVEVGTVPKSVSG